VIHKLYSAEQYNTQEGEISISVYLCTQSYILGPLDDGQSGRNMFLNEGWNKYLLYLMAFTVIIM